jgi:hypothetical protein
MKIAIQILGALIAAVLFSGMGAWPVMVALGILHGYFHVVPALGFWASAVITLAVRVLVPTGGNAEVAK